MHRSGQGFFLPHARVKTKGESECRSCFLLYSSHLYVEKLKWIINIKKDRGTILFCFRSTKKDNVEEPCLL
ncbi:hypothetical protein CON65_11220 [Bacillus pseudomycoides]|uniref:Uncharacterized protein n=1 Tax=Bacillus pseudomycoides TaxID=64104 RepID=A0AA91ZT95_9BACI|nr:hypothetical protein COO03_25880 [Bacillus sp. AFS098217]PED82525.1 hypothetical protein CON65_11220 [Bacillus pseudomycoides]PEU11526.1 hypothetical protein CN525_21980 [Bacillus sp. AFS014408]PEU17281.1 hypothetical protein CN524_02765 [Bacillus sp. AFS019443]PFW60722.1 hypothetical protein COL20_20740 [Bacillus sp. AFS075034]